MGSSFETLGAATEKACFQSDGEFIADPRRSAEKACLPKLSFVFGTISCEIDDLSCLGIFERCRRQAKYSGCCVDRAQYVRVDSLKLIR